MLYCIACGSDVFRYRFFFDFLDKCEELRNNGLIYTTFRQ